MYIGDPSLPFAERVLLQFAGGGKTEKKKFSFFIYANTNATLTLGSLLKSYKIAEVLPSFLKDTGFPRGFEFSIALPEGK